MTVSVAFKKTISRSVQHVVIPVFEGNTLGKSAKTLDKQHGGFIAHALSLNTTFKGKLGETLELYPPVSAGLSRIILLGFGKPTELKVLDAETAGGKLFATLSKSGIAELTFLVEDEFDLKHIRGHEILAHFANGFLLRSYTFDRYKSPKPKKEQVPACEKLEIIYDGAAAAKTLFETLACVTQGVFWARDLVNTPPNDLYPESFAKLVLDELKPLGVEVEVLDDKKMLKMGMGAILAVGQGSERLPHMVILRWNGLGTKGSKKELPAPVAFVGKGVTFDTGGISLKPGPGMEEMKMDMGGAAAVVGLMKALALRGAKAHVVGVIGLAENMPSGNAYRPADIITSYAGKTIEVLNTDAEGRLVLADCLTYVQQTYKPHTVIDLATLTGAILVALGHEYCGTFSNDETLWKAMEGASVKTGEKLWRMPLDDVWKKDVESDIADIQNISKSGRNAGSCTAAGFLNHFIDEGTAWAHMDIAGTAWRKTDLPTVPKWGSGFGVRILDTLVADQYES